MARMGHRQGVWLTMSKGGRKPSKKRYKLSSRHENDVMQAVNASADATQAVQEAIMESYKTGKPVTIVIYNLIPVIER